MLSAPVSDRMEMVLDHARRIFQEIFRYVNNGDLSKESVGYLRYIKCEVALYILQQMSCLAFNILSSLIDQAQDIYITLAIRYG